MQVSGHGPRRFSAIDARASSMAASSSGTGPASPGFKQHSRRRQSKIFDDPAITRGYESVPLIDIDTLPRGGISFDTKAVGRVQFGIPPETIKDSMLLGMEVPSAYIVPVERFCRETGPALGINLAEFEFPAYFNYFVRAKRVQLVVDSSDAERDIRTVFEETLLGPEHFRNHKYPCANFDEDFDPSFPKDARPNFYKEFYNFRTAEKSTHFKELEVSTLLEFVHFDASRHVDQRQTDKLGVPPAPTEFDMEEMAGEQAAARASETNTSDLRRQTEVSGEFEDDPSDHSRERKKEFGLNERPALQRSNSDSSFQSSLGSVDSGRKGKRSEGRRSSLPMNNMAARPYPENEGTVDRRRASLLSVSSDAASMTGRASRVSPVSPASPEKEVSYDGRRASLLSVNSDVTSMTGQASRVSKSSRMSMSGMSMSGASMTSIYPYDFMTDDDGPDFQDHSWMYSQAKWLGEVATVYPSDATDEQKRSNNTARVEIFKMAGGTEYIIHDVDKDNIIVGKARFSGTVRVPDELSVQGFISNEGIVNEEHTERLDDDDFEYEPKSLQDQSMAPTFHPPSFGVTILGNSHGFDKNGSTSGYVLWVNGRGIMIDPPPFASATLEREGIRPQMIMAIIITHCHADHDAGAFQKVMTGARVAIITTPTIYKSFIRKYSALSGLRPSLLRHSHRHRPAIIGQPLRFQGAVFHFTYTLHTIPCISFKVEWRGKSIVFTGDHMNIPTTIDSLQEKGVLSKGRADDLRRLPLQDCDVLLHEAGAPPIHTPLTVLQALPAHIRERLYVVHTAAIPLDSGLRVAPTGTAGTLRLDSVYNDRIRKGLERGHNGHRSENNTDDDPDKTKLSSRPEAAVESHPAGKDAISLTPESLQDGSNQSLTVLGNLDASLSDTLIKQFDGKHGRAKVAPLVFLRPTDVSDAWFILNLLSAVPFLSSLSYAHTMEILEIAHVEMYCAGEVVVQGPRRPEVLCVFWEGACVERSQDNEDSGIDDPTVWHAGDWTSPVSLQPDIGRSAYAAQGDRKRDIVAISEEGVKVITLMMKDVQRILKTGSKLFRKYATLQNEKKSQQAQRQQPPRMYGQTVDQTFESSKDSLLDVIQCNSVLRNLTAMQKRYLETLAEGPRYFTSHTLLWKVGDPVGFAFLIVAGTVTLGKKSVPKIHVKMSRRGSTGAISNSLAAIEEDRDRQMEPILQVESDKLLQHVHPNSEYARLEVGLQLRSEEMEASLQDVESMGEYEKQLKVSKDDAAQTHRDRFANKVLARLYSRRAYTEHLVFSRGNFMADTSRMVSGDLANINKVAGMDSARESARSSIGTTVNDHHCHTSNVMAGSQGCVVMVFPRATLVPFLDSNPGVLLCLLGTQVVV